MKTHIIFTPSDGMDLHPPAGGIGANVTMALPPVDASNTALTIKNGTGGVVYFHYGNAAVIPSGPNVRSPSSGTVNGGETKLIFVGAGEAANIGLCAMAPGSITVTRGTATPAQIFD